MAKKLEELKEKPIGPVREDVPAWSSVKVPSSRGDLAETTLNTNKYLDDNNAKIQRENNDTNRAFDDTGFGLG